MILPCKLSISLNTNVRFYYLNVSDREAKKIIQSYYAAVTYVDNLIGQILNQLNKSKLDENTIIALIGDHGNIIFMNMYHALTYMYKY